MNRQIWNDQRKFNSKFFKDQGFDLQHLSLKDKVKWAKEYYFHISRELADLINCLPDWKMHYKPNLQTEIIKSNIREEFVDSLKYLMGLGQVLGISYNEIIEAYENKTEVVKQKYEQDKLFNKFKRKKVIVFDIDGVINTFPQCFIDWAYKRYKIKAKTNEELKRKLKIEKYEKIKEIYRTCGYKRHLPIIQDTIDTMKELAKNNTIILYTVRPVSKYKRIYSDTLFWLKKNKVPFDAIFWSDYHKGDIYKLNLNIKFIVEDDVRNTKMFNDEGYKVYLLDKYHNQEYSHKLMKRVKNVSEILKYENKKKTK